MFKLCCPSHRLSSSSPARQVVDEADERAMMQFMSRDPKPRRVLADLIMDKIREKEAEVQSSASEMQSEPGEGTTAG